MNYYVDLRSQSDASVYTIPIVRAGACRNPEGDVIGATNAYLTMNGRPWQPIAGECHFSRLPQETWDDELGKMAAGGINTVSTYVFWNHHEFQEGEWNFDGCRDLRKFLTLCSAHGLFVIVRLGPYCHAEVRNGGLPDWMYGKPYEVRSLDQAFLEQVRIWYRHIADQLSGLYFKDGGPVIAAQLDNEYMSSSSPWEMMAETTRSWVSSGDDGVGYLRALQRIAVDEGIDVPLFTCTGWGSPVPDDMLPLWGGYAYRPWLFYDGPGKHPATDEYVYRDYHDNAVIRNADFDPLYDPRTRPYACCEMGGGMFNAYHYRFVLPMPSVDAMANVKLGSGCNLLGYYMFHGGTNPIGPGDVYLNEGQVPKRSYDFQAPIGECGQIRESYRRLKTLHQFIAAFGSELTAMPTVLPAGQSSIKPEDRDHLRFAVRSDGDAGFVFINNFQDHVSLPQRMHESIRVELTSGDHVDFDDLSLARDENCILPFHMDLDGITLITATAQPVTCVDIPDVHGKTFVFMRPPGMKNSSFVFARGTMCNGKPSDRFVVENREFDRFSVGDDNGHAIEIICLSRVLADRMFVISGQALVFPDPHSTLYSTAIGETGICRVESLGDCSELLSYPRDCISPVSDVHDDAIGTEECHRSGADLDGVRFLFGHYSPSPRVKRIHDHRFSIGFSSHSLHELRSVEGDAIMNIDYLGDVASLCLDGIIVDDNFNNGETWSISLRPYAERLLAGSQMVLVITPKVSEAIVDVNSPMAARTVSVEHPVVGLRSIEIHAVHHASFMMRTSK